MSRRKSKLAGKLRKPSGWDRRREQRKAATHICIRKCCRRRPRPKRRVCDTCESREKFARNPLLRLFHNLKSSAKRRKKPFKLTYDWFKAWAVRCGYDRLHGRQRNCLTIDRRDHRKGYVVGNIRALTQSENGRKGWYERHGKPWEAATADDDMKKSEQGRERLIEELHRQFGTTREGDLLNALCDDGFASDSCETLADVTHGDLVRAFNSKQVAA